MTAASSGPAIASNPALPPPPDGGSNWRTRDVPLKFQLSYLTLGSVRRRLLETVVGLHTAPLASPPSLPASALVASGHDGYLLRCLPLAAEQPLLQRRDGLLSYCPYQYLHSHIDLRGSFAAYQAKFSSKTRSTILRKVRKFAEHSGGTIDWKVYRSPEEIEAFISLAREVSSHTYQEKLLNAGLPGDEAFRARARGLAAHDHVRAFLLFDQGKPVSYLYCPQEQGNLVYAYLGYLPQYQSWSVGTVLQWLALEHLFGEGGHRLFDFTEGQSDHKRLFATHQQRAAHVYLLRDTWRNRWLVRAHAGCDRAGSAVGAWMEKHGLKQRVKRWLRRGGRA